MIERIFIEAESFKRPAPPSSKAAEGVAENRTARRHKACGPPGGLFGIDQEVVTLRGLYGNSGILTDLRQADPILIHR